MNIFIQPSQPNRLIENLDEESIKDLTIIDSSFEENCTVFDHLKKNNGIYWDWKGVAKNTIKNGDYIFIYFSGKGKSALRRINCLMKVENIVYINKRERPLIAYLQKIEWFDDNTANILSYNNLKNNYLNTSLPRILNITSNKDLIEYISLAIGKELWT